MNLSKDEAILARLQETIQSMSKGLLFEPEPLVGAEDASLASLAGDLSQLARQYVENHAFLRELAKGNLGIEAPPHNGFAAPYKQLQAELRHLTWQIQEISKGNLDQQVSFSGDFAGAINAMIESLREKQRLDEQNQANAALLRTIFETAGDGMMIADLEGRVQCISRAGLAMFPLDAGESPEGLNFFDRLHPEDREKARQSIDQLLRGESSAFSEYRVIRKDGSHFWNESNAAVLRDAEGKVDRLFIVFRDITGRKDNEEKLRNYSEELEGLNIKLMELATIDALTGVFNRRSFDTRIQQEIQRAIRFGGRFCLVMFDIDHFKRFNDRFGHAAGDMVLVSICGAVGLHIRQLDGLYRYGGEEFMLILAETGLEEGMLVAESLRALVEGLEFRHNDAQLPPTTASFGVGCSSQLDALDAMRMVEAVDAALYQAKASGRNCVRQAEFR